MSRTHPTEVETVELHYWCRTCGAQVDEWCIKFPGPSYRAELHVARFQSATRAGALPLAEGVAR